MSKNKTPHKIEDFLFENAYSSLDEISKGTGILPQNVFAYISGKGQSSIGSRIRTEENGKGKLQEYYLIKKEK